MGHAAEEMGRDGIARTAGAGSAARRGAAWSPHASSAMRCPARTAEEFPVFPVFRWSAASQFLPAEEDSESRDAETADQITGRRSVQEVSAQFPPCRAAHTGRPQRPWRAIDVAERIWRAGLLAGSFRPFRRSFSSPTQDGALQAHRVGSFSAREAYAFAEAKSSICLVKINQPARLGLDPPQIKVSGCSGTFVERRGVPGVRAGQDGRSGKKRARRRASASLALTGMRS